jgi:L-2-hydroxycarboxylate dehydrogenase (NAD+)
MSPPRSTSARHEEAAPVRVPLRAIASLIADAMTCVGLPRDDAHKVAELMSAADLAGADAHGVFRLSQYVQRIKAGGLNPRPNIRVIRTAPATALVDGDNGMGHLAVARAAETAVELARETGVAWVGTRRSNHAGAGGVYAEIPLKADMIGIYGAVSSANHMGVWGGADMLLGTNPIAFAVPAGGEAPVVLDIATSVVSYGTVKNYRLQGRDMPEGWLVSSRDGQPITDPNRSNEGVLLPIGGYKGSGLALMIGLIGGILNGAKFGRDVVDFNADQKSEANTGQFVIALDVARFLPLDQFKSEMDRHLRDLRSSKLLPGFDEIRLPGSARRRRREERLRDGVPIVPELMAQLDGLAAELGIASLLSRHV